LRIGKLCIKIIFNNRVTSIIRFLVFIVLVISACVIAGVYGIVHDQLTYTIAPEYYTRFKFFQFELLDEGMSGEVPNPRLWVAVVGFLATWWMGFPIGLILGLCSVHPNPKIMFMLGLKAFAVTIVIAFITGLFGLVIGYMPGSARVGINPWSGKRDLDHYLDFMAVGSMHNASYMGGFLGLAVAIAYLVRKKRKLS